VGCTSVPEVGIPQRLQSTIAELHSLQENLSSGEVSPQLLSDFRAALNRVRNAAWAVQQSAIAGIYEQGAEDLKSFLAAERVRAAYQACRSLQNDLNCEDIEFKKGQLVEMHGLIAELKEQLKNKL